MGCQAAKAAVLAMYTMNVRNVVDTTPKLPVVATAASVAQAKPRNAKEREKSIKIKPKGDGATCGWGWNAGLPLPSLPSPSGPLYVARTLEIPCRCAPHAETCVLIFWQKRTSTGEAKAQRTGEPRTRFTCSVLSPPLAHRKKNKQHCGAATGDCAGTAACGRMGGNEAGQGGEKDRERGTGTDWQTATHERASKRANREKVSTKNSNGNSVGQQPQRKNSQLQQQWQQQQLRSFLWCE